jgi:hypothetical protein
MNLSKRKANQPALLFICCALLFACPAAMAGSNDWTVVVSAKRQDQFLNYPGSKLAPVIKTPVEYDQAGQHVYYEDLYYSQGQPIGLRQYHALDIQPGSAGVIRIKNLGQVADEGSAAANAAIRTYLDLFLHRTLVLYISVSKDAFDNLLQGMERYGFRRFEIQPEKPVFAVTVLRVVSDPPGRSENLLYAQ